MPLLLEREAHLQAIAVAIAAAQAGRGSVVFLEGPAGIGKSALLAATRPPSETRRLRARGGELERELPLAVARQLLEPPLLLADAARRERLLEATGPAHAALEGRTGMGDGDTAALLHGLHRLARNLATEAPLVVEVDDVQWADATSLRFLCFLVRRLHELPIAVLLARRTGEASTDEPALEAIVDDIHTERRTVEPLSVRAAGQLIADLSEGTAEAGFVAACHAASAGNPFILRELFRAVSGAGVPLAAEGAGRITEGGPPSVARWVLRRLEGLPAEASRLARVVAVLGPYADLGRAAALADVSLEDAERYLDALISKDVLVYGRPLDFVHPVVRAAIHDGMSPGERSTIHRGAARLLYEQRVAPDAVAAHLAIVEPGGNRWVAEALLEGARLALNRGAPEIAAAHMERALAEPPPPELLPRLYRRLGNAEQRLGRSTADAHFLAAYEASRDVRERAHILLDQAITGGISQSGAIARMRATLHDVQQTDPELAMMLRARMITAMEVSLEPLGPELDAAAGRLAAHQRNTLGARLMAATLTFHKALAGDRSGDVMALGLRAIGDEATYLADLDAGYPHMYALMGLGCIDAFVPGERRLELAVARARERGSLIGAVIALNYRSLLRRRTGRLEAAREDAQAALDLSTRSSDGWATAMSAALLVEALVEIGRLYDARAVLAEHRHLEEQLPPPPLVQLLLARAGVNLATARPADARADAMSAGRLAETLGVRNPISTPWRARAATALVNLGHAEEARRLARQGLTIAEVTEIPSAIGQARRVLAASVEQDAAIPLLREAVTALEPAPAPLELARALIDLGSALRRVGRRRESREPLGQALEIAHCHGAEPLTRAARTELRAAGARPRREMRTGVDALTPSERRVADLAASGLSNPQIAACLFITRKTTEHHLAATYRKLGISSRGELPAVLDGSRSGGSSDLAEADWAPR